MPPNHTQCKSQIHSSTSKALSYLTLPDPQHLSELTSLYSLPCSLSFSHASIHRVSRTWQTTSVCKALAVPLPGMLLPQTCTGPVLSLPLGLYSKDMFSVRLSLVFLSVQFHTPAWNFLSPSLAFFSFYLLNTSLWKCFLFI